ncbi:MAG: TonB-dependent receptor [Bacteroidota bacterium]
MEGDAIGGTVNFVTKSASSGWNGKARYLHGYNGQQEEFGQHRVNFELGNRFLDDKIGLLVSANYQKADRSQDRFGGDFLPKTNNDNEAINETFAENVNLEDRLETRYRYGATASLDYTFKRGDIRLFSNYSQTDRDQIRRRRRYRYDSRRQEYEIIDDQTENALFANTLSGVYTFDNKLEVSMNGSYSLTRISTPFNHSIRFRENSAYENTEIDFPDANQIINLARNDLSTTFMQRARSDEDQIDFDRYSAQIDLKLPFQLGNNISGKIQGGAKYRGDNRRRDLRRFQARETDQIVAIAAADGGERYPDSNESQIFISNFFGDFVATDFLDGDVFLGPGSGRVNGGHLSLDLANQFYFDNLNLYQRDAFVDGSDYEADESITSGYLMAEFNFNSKLNILLGVRNETTRLDYIGYQIAGSTASSEIEIGDDPLVLLTDSTLSRSYTEWLPSINLKYQVTDWMDIRAAATRTLSRPDFINMIPFVSTDLQQRIIQRGNFNLQHQVSTNFDLFFSAYNDFGLITIGGFYKEIQDADFIRGSRVTPLTDGLGENPDVFNGFDLIQPENADLNSVVKGIEIDIQATLASLPSPWNGILLSANASFISSETFYPVVEFASNPPRPVNLVRQGRFTGQPDQVYNFSVGYEKGGFSGRLSMIHQGRTFGEGGQAAGERLGGLDAQVQTNAIRDQFVERTTRFDLAVKQKVVKNTLLFFNWNNITNQEEVLINRGGDILERERFGFTMDLGLQYKF